MRVVVFDCDGTLVDSQRAILHAMRAAFADHDLDAPSDEAIRRIVGLSVPEAVAMLAQRAPASVLRGLDARFRHHSVAYRASNPGEESPLYPGARAALERLDSAGVAMAMATGKARRGVEHLLETQDLRRFFAATQSADDAPSKPHPGMLENVARATGAERMVMVGDTTYDVDMARNFGCPAIGVSWGYHPAEMLREAGAAVVVDSFDALDAALAEA